ncbi:MAG: bifunctional demethylmenaquinone methyltransferase/2-methoxy-6-polyprenyl-1,4-benzoquinol methylase UbiE [Porticoccaceae bacterium]|jgi:demethylmenaquinone methyltransferase / 2-methoxy-6-polyprenyl-1,4-benzoquinol methylase|nr:bifunctional demethylmenaquinone methyltransferase/2-methoxy-6-polyprenyl-1,4-benzoquinol methylase UbiE [Porticoccaceae bacterium]
MTEEKTTHFGFTEVPESEKVNRVAGVFHSVAAQYDLMNDLMSFGIHRVWKQITIESSGVRRGARVLDLAGGTGDLAAAFAKRVGDEGQVVLADINDAMLSVGRDKLADTGSYNRIRWVQADAEKLPFEDKSFDCVTIAFGLRNVTRKEAALESIYRVLKPGGRLLVLEFSKPLSPALEMIYDRYSFDLLPKMGQWVTGDAESYRYLAESIRKHPDQDTLRSMMETAGFNSVSYTNLTGGVVALHKGFRFDS